MGWFSRRSKREKDVEAAITLATNLYIHTIAGEKITPVPLQFGLPDSRFRYLLFCLSATLTAVLAYDETKNIEPDVLFNGCLNFVKWTAAENTREYFSSPTSVQDALANASAYFMEFFLDTGQHGLNSRKRAKMRTQSS